MYDTLKLWLPSEAIKETQILKSIPQYLSNITESYKLEADQHSYSGDIGKFKANLYETGVSLSGSICKDYFGNNFATLTRGDTQRAIESLSDRLHLPIKKANVKRIDLAQNFIMKYSENLYYAHLGMCNHYDRLEQNNGLYYSNHKKQMLFYGKVYEQKIKGQLIPELYKNHYTLRYEFRLLNRIPDQMNTSEIKGQTLFEESFYIEILSRWLNEYSKITKVKACNLSPENMKNLKTFENQIYLAGLQSMFGDEVNAIKALDNLKNQGVFENKMQPNRIKNKIKEIFKNPLVTYESEVIKELDTKIQDAISFYR